MRINIELLDLRVFLAIFDLGSFRKAAELLHLSQPALSRRLQALEARLETSLFERSTRSVVPTAAARQWEPMARRLLDELDASILSVGGIGERQRGQIAIAAIPSAATNVLPAVIRQFKTRYPHIRLRMLDRSPQEGLDCVVSGEVEFGINMIGAGETGVTFTSLLDDPYVLVCHRNTPLARKNHVAWRHLEGHQLVSIGRASSGNRVLLDSALAKSNLHLDWFYEVTNLSTALSLVGAGLGAAVLPRLATPRGHHPAIVTKAIRSPQVSRAIGLVERRKASLSPPAKYLRDMLLGDFQKRSVRNQC